MALSRITNPFLSSSGAGNASITSPAANTIAFSTTTTERMRIDSAGNIGIGTASPGYKFDIAGGVSDILRLTNTSASGYEEIKMTVGTQSARIVLTGQSFGDANYGTGDLTIQAQTAGKGIRFGTNGGVNQMILDSAGLLTLASGQIKFPASQNASADANTLDDYEEGTWTPVWSPATTNFASITYAADTGGRYTKIGRLVYVQFFIQVSSYSGGSGLLRLQGFPFSTDGVSNQQSGVTVHLAGSWGSNTPYSLDLGGTSANAKYRTSVNGTIDSGNLNVTDMATNCFVRATFCYQTS